MIGGGCYSEYQNLQVDHNLLVTPTPVLLAAFMSMSLVFEKCALQLTTPLVVIHASAPFACLPTFYQDFANRRSQSVPLSITYGSTELINAEGFLEQLMELGQK